MVVGVMCCREGKSRTEEGASGFLDEHIINYLMADNIL